MTDERLKMTNAKGGSAYLIRIDINDAEAGRSGFKKAMDSVEHSADVHVSFNGEEKEFTLAEFGKLLGFKSEIEIWAEEMTGGLRTVCANLDEAILRIERALQDNINRVGGLK